MQQSVTNVESMTFWFQVSSFFKGKKIKIKSKKKYFSNSMIAKKNIWFLTKKREREKRKRRKKKIHSEKAFSYVHFFRCSCIHKCIIKISRIQTCILKKNQIKISCIQTCTCIHSNSQKLKVLMHSYIHIFRANRQLKIDLLDEQLKVWLHVGRSKIGDSKLTFLKKNDSNFVRERTQSWIPIGEKTKSCISSEEKTQCHIF